MAGSGRRRGARARCRQSGPVHGHRRSGFPWCRRSGACRRGWRRDQRRNRRGIRLARSSWVRPSPASRPLSSHRSRRPEYRSGKHPSRGTSTTPGARRRSPGHHRRRWYRRPKPPSHRHTVQNAAATATCAAEQNRDRKPHPDPGTERPECAPPRIRRARRVFAQADTRTHR